MVKIEPLVKLLRAQIGLTGFPRHPHHWQLAALLTQQREVLVEVAPVACPYIYMRRDGVRLITLPEAWPQGQQDEALLEEIGHSQTERYEIGRCFPRRQDERARLRLLMLHDDREEALSRRFVLAWKLPLDLIACPERLEDLTEESGCSQAEIRERLRRLGWLR